MAATKRRVCDVVEDAEFLATVGERFDHAATRLGYTPRTLERTLARAGRYDLVTRLKTNSNRRPQ
jgi:hypothetical protein